MLALLTQIINNVDFVQIALYASCIIIYKPKDKSIQEEIIDRCYHRHSDGAGFAYLDRDKKRLVVSKGYEGHDDLAKLKEALSGLPNDELLLHFRTASPQMIVNEENCHPFLVETKVDPKTKVPGFQFAIAHNGRLNVPTTFHKSDTNCFVNGTLTDALDGDPWLFYARGRSEILEMALGNDRMAAFCYDVEKDELVVALLNKHKWSFADGVWYSNDTYLKPPRVQRWIPEKFRGTKINVLGKEIGWGDPDDNGWFWDFAIDSFRNEKTGVVAKLVSYRQPPYEGSYFSYTDNQRQIWHGYQGGFDYGTWKRQKNEPASAKNDTSIRKWFIDYKVHKLISKKKVAKDFPGFTPEEIELLATEAYEHVLPQEDEFLWNNEDGQPFSVVLAKFMGWIMARFEGAREFARSDNPLLYRYAITLIKDGEIKKAEEAQREIEVVAGGMVVDPDVWAHLF